MDKSKEYLNANYLTADAIFSHIEIYTIGKNEINNPSKWSTEIYYPVRPKTVTKPTVITPQTTPEVVPKAKEEKEIPSEF